MTCCAVGHANVRAAADVRAAASRTGKGILLGPGLPMAWFGHSLRAIDAIDHMLFNGQLVSTACRQGHTFAQWTVSNHLKTPAVEEFARRQPLKTDLMNKC